jgi:hypothetical protein
MAKIIDTVLLLALPASGKSEVRKYLDGLSPEVCRGEFHIGPTVQLDDFPYVHVMRRIDDELAAAGAPRMFFHSPDRPFQDPRDWRTLIELVNEDYADLMVRRPISVSSAARWIVERVDCARARVGINRFVTQLKPDLLAKVCDKLEKEAADLLRDKLKTYPDTLEGKTVVIEFARGGPDGSSMPLPEPLGYQGSIPVLSPAILEKAVVLYIWVTPEESRRKNQARANPDDPGSILHHGVPMEVMLKDYGCDDMAHLLEQSGKEDTVKVAAHGRDYLLPLVRFDNRVDKTSFIRNDRKDWKPEEIKAVHDGLQQAFRHVHGRLA